MLKTWELNKSEQIFECNIFNILQKFYKKPEGQGDATAFIIDCPDWVNVIGIDDKNNVLLIRQFRYGTDSIELEIPGGILEPGELPKEGAIRELKEETGYDVKEIEQIGFVNANPAIMNNKCYTFLAKLSRNRGQVNFDPDEIIEMEFATPKQVKKYLVENKITNAYVVLAFLWFYLYNNFE